MSVEKINSNLSSKDKIESLNSMVIEVDGKVNKGTFDVNEVSQIFSFLDIDRKYIRNTSLGHSLSDYIDWSHLLTEDGYSIWKISPTNYEYDSLNQLFFDDKLIDNRGQALSETATAFSKVYLYNGSTYVDNTTEAGSEGGTEFDLMDATGEYLYVGLATTFAGVKLELESRGSNYNLVVEYYDGSSGDGWSALTANTNNLSDNTSNFESDGYISWDIPDDWAVTNTESGDVNKYYIRISTSTTPVTTASAYYVIPANNVPGLLALSSEQFQNEEWAWCSYGSSIYVTIRNTGNTSFEGDYYITSASSVNNLKNFFIYNHEYKIDNKDFTYNALLTKTSDYVMAGGEGIILADASSSSVVITLPTAVGIDGKRFTIICIGLESGFGCSIDTYGVELIGGSGTYAFSSDYEAITLISDGTNYQKLAVTELSALPDAMTKVVYDTDNNGIVDLAEGIDDETYSATAQDIADSVSKKHTANADTDLDPTFEATFVKKTDTVNVLSDITSPGSDIEDAVTKKHSQNSDTDLDATFEDTFVKKVDTVNVLSDITSAGADIEDAVTKRHTQNTDTDLDATFEDTFMKKTDSINDLDDVDFDSGTPADDQVLTYDIGTSKWKAETPAGGAGGSPWRFIDLPAGSWYMPTSNPAPLSRDVGTNGDIMGHLFDDTTEEFLEGQIRLPSDLDASGTIYIQIFGYAVTAVSSKNVEFTFYHSAKADGESWDAAYDSKISGDLATDGTQDQLDSFEFSETVSNLGWASDDQVRIKLSRTAPTADNLSGDYFVTHVRLKIARA